MSQCDNPLGADNQQERSILSLDFIAGLITGEGSYFIGARRQRDYISLYPGFSMRMNDVDTIERVIESFKAHELPIYRNPAVYHRCVSVSVIGHAQMRRHLEAMLPLLSGNKQRAAQIVSDFLDRRLAHPNKRYTSEDIDLVEQLREINGPSRMRLPIEILRDYTLRPNSRGKWARYSPNPAAT